MNTLIHIGQAALVVVVIVMFGMLFFSMKKDNENK